MQGFFGNLKNILTAIHGEGKKTIYDHMWPDYLMSTRVI